jgi:hypothetical protein
MNNDAKTLIGVDVDAVQDAVQALADADIDVTGVEDIDRTEQASNQTVAFTLECRAATRTASLDDFDTGAGD